MRNNIIPKPLPLYVMKETGDDKNKKKSDLEKPKKRIKEDKGKIKYFIDI